MEFKPWIRSFWDDLKAWRRDEMRVAPRGTRGRVYERKHPTVNQHEKDIGTNFTYRANATAKATLVGMRVTRANGVVESYDAEGNLVALERKE